MRGVAEPAWNDSIFNNTNYKDSAMFIYDNMNNFMSDDGQKGATTVEYAVVISLLIGLALIIILLLVDPTRGAGDSVLPNTYNAVSQKIGNFGTLPE